MNPYNVTKRVPQIPLPCKGLLEVYDGNYHKVRQGTGQQSVTPTLVLTPVPGYCWRRMYQY
eukprot:2456164-Rhodomonas_salina.1